MSLFQFQGRWSDAKCDARWSDLSVAGPDITFRDQSGAIDVERIIDAEPGQFLTRGVASSRSGVGSLWQYSPLGSDVVQVKNLKTGAGFTLRRCPAVAGATPPPGLHPVAAPAIPGSSPSFDCQKARNPVALTICSDAGLRRLDLDYNQTYQAYRQQLIEDQRPLLQQDATAFGKALVQACQLPSTGVPDTAAMVRAVPCLTRSYETKRAEYLSRLTPEAKQEATRDIGAHLALQSRLVETGMLAPSAPVDGVYGPIVRDAITRVQAQHALPQTGLMSNATAAFISPASSATQSATASTAADEAGDAQRRTAERMSRLLAGQDDQPNGRQAETSQTQAGEQGRLRELQIERNKAEQERANQARAKLTRQEQANREVLQAAEALIQEKRAEEAARQHQVRPSDPPSLQQPVAPQINAEIREEKNRTLRSRPITAEDCKAVQRLGTSFPRMCLQQNSPGYFLDNPLLDLINNGNWSYYTNYNASSQQCRFRFQVSGLVNGNSYSKVLDCAFHPGMILRDCDPAGAMGGLGCAREAIIKEE